MKEDFIAFIAIISFCFSCTGVLLGYFLWFDPGSNDTLGFNIIWTIATVVFAISSVVCFHFTRLWERRREVRSAVTTKNFYDYIDRTRKEREARN